MSELLTTNEAAKWLKLSPLSVRIMARKGQIPHIRVGRGLRFQPDAVLAYLQSNSGVSVTTNAQAA